MPLFMPAVVDPRLAVPPVVVPPVVVPPVVVPPVVVPPPVVCAIAAPGIIMAAAAIDVKIRILLSCLLKGGSVYVRGMFRLV